MKTKLLVIILLCKTLVVIAQTTAIPDANFEQFLIDQGIDTNGANGTILNTDAQVVTNLNINRNDITDFTGLAAFVNLVVLDAGSNQFTTLPLTTLIALEELRFTENVVLANLDLSTNVNLKKLDIRANGGVNNAPITVVDMSSNLQLEEIHIYNFGDLENYILPVTNTLRKLYIYSRHDLTVDLSDMDNLEWLNLGVGASKVMHITLPDVKDRLKYVRFYGGNITTMDFSPNINLETIILTGTDVNTLSLPTTNTLTKVNILIHKISTISFASTPMLENLTISSKKGLSPLQLDITQNIQLKQLRATSNKMVAIDVSQNINLETVTLSNNNLQTLDMYFKPKLKRLAANTNQLTNVNVVQCAALQTLDLGNNQLSTLDITKNTRLQSLSINKNLFKDNGLDLTKNIDLEAFYASFNQIKRLDITQNINISDLVIDNNQFTGNDILNQYYQNHIASDRKLDRRSELSVHHNQLTGKIPDFTTLIDKKYTALFRFEFHNNQFHFGDFENEHLTYVSYLTTLNEYPYPQYLFQKYTYAPQAKVNTIENLTPDAGDNITLTTEVRGLQNHYKWFKDGTIITDAPDSPKYIINNINDCDNGVYHCEITSDLVPFENNDPPETNGKNLLLVRNDINLAVVIDKTCVTLSNPIHNSTSVPVNTSIKWTEDKGACGYKLNIGTSSGATDLVNNEDVGNRTTYSFASDLPENTKIFVTITPYFSDGDITGCTEESFTTNDTVLPLPDCTTITSPVNGATDVNIDTNIVWNTVSNANDYLVHIGTSSGANNIASEVVTGTSYDHPADLSENPTYYVIIIPQNNVGQAIGCIETSFTTAKPIITILTCTTLMTPANNATNVAINTNLQWNPVTDADGYRITIGTTARGNDILNSHEVTGTIYDFTTNLAENQQHFVTIIPFNSSGTATGCIEENFTTAGSMVTIPTCTTLITPANNTTNVAINANLQWNLVTDADGYRITIGTTAGGNDILNSHEVTGTIYDFTTDLAENQQHFVTIVPFNSTGTAIGCSEESFTTESIVITENDTTKYGFSPDGDGINEYWKIDGIEAYTDNTVTIYNRWGDKVFEISGYNNTSRVFRGTANRLSNLGGDELPEGTYFFMITVPQNHSLKKLSGFLVLKR